ncbi:MAG: thioredoxin domain-containing protein [Armatimonadota bacterium]|nr:thioredoxin domain-containing protein [Armatimonadota bacterium]MDR5675432.1 thioredoxin domain-containing protein [Armatimonadota bacterium]MDR5688221.1 thioredoxin domain-containing protein [Armatimonadota bacterium]MDR7413224.1 thioredoxin domain-containing protein [Armatimonadota bacterium]MDR7432406.1 thioredoxin domain-containing protein [Armatimonadota bacterium]
MERALVVLLVGAAVAAGAAWLRWRERRVRLHVHVPGGPAVIAFTHRLCAPCRSQQLPALKRLQELVDSHVRVEVVDVERDPHLARRFGVFTVPSTVVVGPDGRVVAFNHGFADEARLLRQLGRTGPEGVPDLLRNPGPEVT